MNRAFPKFSAVFLGGILLSGFSALSADAASGGLKYYACSNYGVVSQVSVTAHSCPAGTTVV